MTRQSAKGKRSTQKVDKALFFVMTEKPGQTPKDASKKLLRMRDLQARGIVSNWVTLRRWIDHYNFPPGRHLGPNTRVWFESEVEEWLAARPKAPLKKPARKAVGAAADRQRTSARKSMSLR
jgi:predicted DNA-binding transcriptional regulator AlpA